MVHEPKEIMIRSKTFVQATRWNRIRYKGIRYCIIGSMILALIELILNGQIISLPTLLLPIFIYGMFKSKPGFIGGYQMLLTKIGLDEKSITMTYYKVNKNDGKGTRNEIISFDYEKIKSLEFSDQLLCIKISGMPVIKQDYENKDRFKDIEVVANGDMETYHLLYIEEKVKDSFLSDIKLYTGIDIIYMDREDEAGADNMQ